MKVAAEQSQVVVTAGFRQLWLTAGAVFALLVLYRLTGFYLSRRPRGADRSATNGGRSTQGSRRSRRSASAARSTGCRMARW
jgi:hypothetical protein